MSWRRVILAAFLILIVLGSGFAAFAKIQNLQEQNGGLQSLVASLSQEIENLKNPPLPIDQKEIIGVIGNQELYLALKQFYPNAFIDVLDYKYQLVGLETLKKFLAADDTNHYQWQEDYYDCDDFSFRLKGQWIQSGFASCPLGIIKGERICGDEKTKHWRNLFVAKENGKLVLYEIEPTNDSVTKVEKPNLETYIVIM